MACTTPRGLTVPTKRLLLLHAPPGGVLESVVVVLPLPRHISGVPVMADGVAITVTTIVLKQPPMSYVMVVVPAPMPVTTPDVLTVPTAGVLLLHEPPGTEFDNVVVAPVHMFVTPVIAAGVLFTVNVVVADAAQRPPKPMDIGSFTVLSV